MLHIRSLAIAHLSQGLVTGRIHTVDPFLASMIYAIGELDSRLGGSVFCILASFG